MNEKIFIVAGNYEQYKQWVKNNIDRYYAKNTSISLSNFVFVSGPEIFRGYNEVHGYYVGSYEKRKDIEQIREMIRIVNSRSDWKYIWTIE